MLKRLFKISRERRHFGQSLRKLEDVECLKLEQVCLKITDGTHKTPAYTESGIPFFRVTDLTGSNESKKFISIDEHKELVKRCKPEKGDVLYSKNGTIGVAKMVDWDYDFSIFVCLALLKPNKKMIDSEYLGMFLNTDNVLSQAKAHSKSGTVTNLHLVEIKQIKIPLPSLEIQKQLVKEMKKEEEIIKANHQLVEIMRDKISAVLNEL